MQAAERPTQQETYISDTEVDQIIQSLKEVLLRNCPQAYKIFDRETNLHRQWQIYVRDLSGYNKVLSHCESVAGKRQTIFASVKQNTSTVKEKFDDLMN